MRYEADHNRKTWPRRVAIAATALAVLMVAAVAIYATWPAPTPVEVAEDYIEGRYDDIAEDLAGSLMPISPIQRELAAEVIELVAEQAAPYSCALADGPAAPDDEVVVDCIVRAQLPGPVEIDIAAPVRVTVETEPDSLRPRPEVTDAHLDQSAITLNGRPIDAATDLLPGRDLLRGPDVRSLAERIRLPAIPTLPGR